MNTPRSLFIALAMLAMASLARAELNEELAKKLFNPEANLEEFTKAADEASKGGASAQIIAEAKLVWGLRHKDTDYLAKVVPELEAVVDIFKKEDSAALGNVEDFKALIHYIKALDAARKGDSAAVKEHITEAFWLSPDQAGLFAQTVTFFRTQAKMAKVSVDMKTSLTNSKGESTTLTSVLGKNKAILLDFWASWCGPCMNLMPELKKKAAYLAKYGVVVAGMNTESDAAIAERTRVNKDMGDTLWLVEPKERPFSDLLSIDSIPRMVLLTPEGKVLFNGHPEDVALWAALKNVDPSIEQPQEASPPPASAPAAGEKKE